MPQSLSFVLVHIIFSTRDRAAVLHAPAPLHAYLATVARNTGCECYRVGGVADHVHLAVRMNRTMTIARLVSDLKTSSSQWLKAQSPKLDTFAWQRGYGVFSVSPVHLQALNHYIETQPAHHAKHTFQEELRSLLSRSGVAWDERHLWD